MRSRFVRPANSASCTALMPSRIVASRLACRRERHHLVSPPNIDDHRLYQVPRQEIADHVRDVSQRHVHPCGEVTSGMRPKSARVMRTDCWKRVSPCVSMLRAINVSTALAASARKWTVYSEGLDGPFPLSYTSHPIAGEELSPPTRGRPNCRPPRVSYDGPLTAASHRSPCRGQAKASKAHHTCAQDDWSTLPSSLERTQRRRTASAANSTYSCSP